MNIITKKWYLTIYTYTYTSQSFFNSVFISIAELVGKDLPIAEMFDSVKLVLIVVVHTVLFQKKGGGVQQIVSLLHMKTEEEIVAH